MGLVGQIVGNGAISTASYLVGEMAEKGNFNGVNSTDIAINLATGLIAGLVGGPGANAGNTSLQSLGNQTVKRIGNAITHKNYGEIAKGILYYLKSTKTLNKELIKSIVKGNLPGLLKEFLTTEEIKKVTNEAIKQLEELK